MMVNKNKRYVCIKRNIDFAKQHYDVKTLRRYSNSFYRMYFSEDEIKEIEEYAEEALDMVEHEFRCGEISPMQLPPVFKQAIAIYKLYLIYLKWFARENPDEAKRLLILLINDINENKYFKEKRWLDSDIFKVIEIIFKRGKYVFQEQNESKMP